MNKIIKILLGNINIVIVISLGLFLRLWGITWGLPLKKAHIDEAVVLFYTMRFFSGDLNPHIFFDYPTFFLYILFASFSIYFLLGKSLSLFYSLDHFVGIYLNHNASAFYIIARSITVLFSVGSIYLIYRIGKENFSVGLLPAFILAITPMHILHSHYATVDISCVFFVLLSFLYLSRYFQKREDNNLYLGSFILGLATAVKYYPAIFFIPLTYFIIQKEPTIPLKKLFIAIVSTISGFLIGCPYALLDFPAFISRFLNRFNLIVWNSPKDISFNPLTPVGNIIKSLSPVLFVSLLVGLILTLLIKTEKRKSAIFFLIFPIFFLLFNSTWKISSVHYILPILPFFILVGSYGISSINLLNRKVLVRLAVIFTFCLPALANAYKTDKLLAKEDTRLKAYRWIYRNIPAGSKILRLPHTPEFTINDPYYVHVDWEGKLIGIPVQELLRKYDYILISHFNNNVVTDWEKSFSGKYQIVKQWDYIALSAFHHPRVIIYGRQA